MGERPKSSEEFEEFSPPEPRDGERPAPVRKSKLVCGQWFASQVERRAALPRSEEFEEFKEFNVTRPNRHRGGIGAAVDAASLVPPETFWAGDLRVGTVSAQRPDRLPHLTAEPAELIAPARVARGHREGVFQGA